MPALAKLLRGAQALVFDFDGTLVDSNPIKRRAFEVCFAEFPDRREEILAYCWGHQHTSRGDKFRYIYEQILGTPYTETIARRLFDRFEAATTRQVIDAPEIPGAVAFLETVKRGPAMTALLSSTWHEALLRILQGRGWLRFFQTVQGSPVDKAHWIAALRQRHGWSREQVVFFGDTAEDAAAAVAGGSAFIALGHTLRDGYDLALPNWRPALAVYGGRPREHAGHVQFNAVSAPEGES